MQGLFERSRAWALGLFCCLLVCLPAQAGQASWTQVGPEAAAFYSAIADGEGGLYAGGIGNVLHRAKGSERWQRVGAHLPQLSLIYGLSRSRQGVLYATAFGSGIYQYDAVAGRWVSIGDGTLPRKMDITWLANDDSGALYAISADYGLYKRAAGASKWVAAGFNNRGKDTILLTLLAANGRLYAGTGTGVHVSRDGGASWTLLSGSMGVTRALSVDAQGQIYAAGYKGIYRSSADGKNWTALGSGMARDDVRALAASPQGQVYAGTDLGSIYKLGEAGQWRKVQQSTGFITALLADGEDTLHAATMQGMLLSRDSGDSWAEHNNGLTEYASADVLFDPMGTAYLHTHVGLFRRTKAETAWQRVYTGMVNDVKIAADGTIYLAPETGAPLESSNQGQDWSPLTGGLDDEIEVMGLVLAQDGGLYAASNGQGLFRRDARAQQWQSVSSEIADRPIFVATRGRDGIYMALGGRAFRGVESSEGYLVKLGTDSKLLALPVPPSMPHTIHEGGSAQAPTLHIATPGGVYELVQGRWIARADGLPAGSNTLDLKRDGNGVLYVAASSGVYRWQAADQRWIAMNNGLPASIPVVRLSFDHVGGVYAGTFGGGVFHYSGDFGNKPMLISGEVGGTTSMPLLAANIAVATADQDQPGYLYVAAILPDGSLYVLSGGAWQLYDGKRIPAYAQVTLDTHRLAVLDGTLDVTGLKGTQVLVGYGRSEQDLLLGSKYAVIHILQ